MELRQLSAVLSGCIVAAKLVPIFMRIPLIPCRGYAIFMSFVSINLPRIVLFDPNDVETGSVGTVFSTAVGTANNNNFTVVPLAVISIVLYTKHIFITPTENIHGENDKNQPQQCVTSVDVAPTALFSWGHSFLLLLP